MALAFAYYEEGKRQGQGMIVMEAIKQFRKVLELDPTQSRALLAIASISLENGLADKAIQYYERYLQVAPDDLRARTDYGMAMLLSGSPIKAFAELDTVLEREPNFVPAMMTKAVALRMSGKEQEARVLAEQAMNASPSEDVKARIKTFLEGDIAQGGQDKTGG